MDHERRRKDKAESFGYGYISFFAAVDAALIPVSAESGVPLVDIFLGARGCRKFGACHLP
jgi:hypothetical protein